MDMVGGGKGERGKKMDMVGEGGVRGGEEGREREGRRWIWWERGEGEGGKKMDMVGEGGKKMDMVGEGRRGEKRR